MGNSVSAATTVTDVLNDVNSTMTTIMESTTQNNSEYCTSNNTITLNFGKVEGCGFDVAQTSNLNCQLNSVFNSSSNTNLSTIMSQAAQQSQVAQATAAGDMFSTSNVNTKVNESASTYLQNLISTNVSLINNSNCLAQGTVNNTLTLNVGDYDCTSNPNAVAKLGQAAQLQVVANCTTTILNDLINSSESYQSASQSSSGTTNSSAAGLTDLVSSIGSAIAGIIGAIGSIFSSPAIIALVVVAVCVGGFFLFQKMQGGGMGGGGMAGMGSMLSGGAPAPAPMAQHPAYGGQPQSYYPPAPAGLPIPMNAGTANLMAMANNLSPQQMQGIAGAAKSYLPLVEKLAPLASAL